MFGIYLHIPFCQSKCSYCDFNSYPGLGELFQPYKQALLAEIRERAENTNWPLVTSVYFGGGNPYLIGGRALSAILEELRQHFLFAPQAEISLEANPRGLDFEELSFLRQAGFNRLSLGFQSFSPRFLKLLGRNHQPDEARESFWKAREAGFSNLNIDLIFNLPGQTLKDWQEDLFQAIKLNPSHISTYSLTLDSNTPLARKIKKGEISIPSEDEAAAMYQKTMELLPKLGYLQYEISNFARAGYRCAHNLLYWKRENYLGFGAGAHSFWQGQRFWSIKSPADYIKRVTSGQSVLVGREVISPRKEFQEKIFLGLRLVEGVAISNLNSSLKRDFRDSRQIELKKLLRCGLIALEPTRKGIRDESRGRKFLRIIPSYPNKVEQRIKLTQKGRLLANEVMVSLI